MCLPNSLVPCSCKACSLAFNSKQEWMGAEAGFLNVVTEHIPRSFMDIDSKEHKKVHPPQIFGSKIKFIIWLIMTEVNWLAGNKPHTRTRLYNMLYILLNQTSQTSWKYANSQHT